MRRDWSVAGGEVLSGLFQSTRLREARLKQSGTCGQRKGFQSTRLREARLYCQLLELHTFCFNPRACVRRDPDSIASTSFFARFNPRACVRRDLWLG